MKFTIYPSDKGDCNLVTGKDGKRILADGGMQSSYTATVAPQLAQIRAAKGQLDVVYVSHIDDDHIGGVLRLMDDSVDWAIHEFHFKHGNTTHKVPPSPRPPDIGEIWHNGFRDLVKENAGPIEDQLAANAKVLSAFVGPDILKEAVREHQQLAESIPQAVKLSRRIGTGQLGIALNPPAGGKVMMVRPSTAAINVGGMRVRVLAPFAEDLEKLRNDWNQWLRDSKKVLAAIDARAKQDESELTSDADRFIGPLKVEAVLAANWLSQAVELAGGDDLQKKLGDRKKVTTPNLASLMLVVTEGTKSILLTGDGHADDALKGLRHHGLITNGGVHVDILKVQHHGSEHNMTDEFAMAVTADNYVFCGDGFSTNPELVVIQRLFDARLGPMEKVSHNAEAAQPFTFWFNCDSKVPKDQNRADHMREVEKLVAQLVKQSKKKMTAHFMGPGQLNTTIAL
jgi:hypothetical protein